MKLTKEQLKQIIKEELGKVQEYGIGGTPDSPEQIVKNKAYQKQRQGSDALEALAPQVETILKAAFLEYNLDYDDIAEELFLPDGVTEEDPVMIQWRKLRSGAEQHRIDGLETAIINAVWDS